VGVKVVLFNGKGSWDLTALIHLVRSEHRLASHVLDNIIRLRVSKVTTLIDRLTLLIVFTAILVF